MLPLPEHLKLLSWDLYLLGSLVDMFVHAIFDVALDVQVALSLLVQAGIGFIPTNGRSLVTRESAHTELEAVDRNDSVGTRPSQLQQGTHGVPIMS